MPYCADSRARSKAGRGLSRNNFAGGAIKQQRKFAIQVRTKFLTQNTCADWFLMTRKERGTRRVSLCPFVARLPHLNLAPMKDPQYVSAVAYYVHWGVSVSEQLY